jgi:uncharacterized protein (TIGR02145 family)
MRKLIIKALSAATFAAFFCMGCVDNSTGGGVRGNNNEPPEPGPATPEKTQFTDGRDGAVYNKVTIGKQVWMAENLNYAGEDEDNEIGVCFYNEAPFCELYGRLYDWHTVMDGASSSATVPSGVRGICPSGWHLPSDAEWMVLTDYVGGEWTAGSKLRSTTNWYSNGNGTDEYGFTAMPGGIRYSGGGFTNTGNCGYWWSATENSGTDYVWYRSMIYHNGRMNRYDGNKISMFSVRCVMD